MRRFFPCALLLLFVTSLLLIAPSHAAEYTKPIRIVVPVTKGLQGGNFSKLMTDVIKVASEQTGYKFVYTERVFRMGDDDSKLVYDMIKAGKAEMGYVNSVTLVEKEKEWGGFLKPAFALVFDGKIHQDECLYVREDSGLNTLDDLRGKTWGGSRVYFTRLILHDNGIDEPLSKFFSKTVFIEDAPPTVSIDALQKHEVDCVEVNKHHLAIGGAGVTETEADKKNKTPFKYKEIVCTPGELNWTFVFSPTVPADVAAKITGLFVTAHKNKAFSQFRFIFTAIKGGFAPITDKDFDRSREIAKLKTSLGWNEEQKEFIKKRKK